jgi:peptidoglycan/xylan/chitin deacetylase (PgdA/CDA1 family)
VALPGSDQARWVVDPFAFFRRALALPPMPVPDTTTENGRRLSFVHIDGDGYASRAELPGTPLAGRALLEQVLKKHRAPTTLSVIEGEVAPHGLYPAISGEMEEIARESFALPHVEIATHTYSHPFRWREAAAADESASVRPYHLELPGYRFDLQREIAGSADYIQRRLAPPGKPVRLVLWSGDAQPAAAALQVAESRGLLNMNGGETVITRANPSLTAVAPLGVGRRTAHGARLWQTYAPMMNENVYTNLWTGPFYGFARVIETFELTGAPRRLKPIDLYFHTYSASKRASLTAL